MKNEQFDSLATDLLSLFEQANAVLTKYKQTRNEAEAQELRSLSEKIEIKCETLGKNCEQKQSNKNKLLSMFVEANTYLKVIKDDVELDTPPPGYRVRHMKVGFKGRVELIRELMPQLLKE
jgi:hypothetical protein